MNLRLRFHVLQRDGFTCRYCGRHAPDVQLHVDHVVPRSQGGRDDPTNLVAACKDCNLGKAACPSDLDAAIGRGWEDMIQGYVDDLGHQVVIEALLEMRCFPVRHRRRDFWRRHSFASDFYDNVEVVRKRRGVSGAELLGAFDAC